MSKGDAVVRDEDVVLVFDIKLKRPACALLQAAFGGDHRVLLANFPVETWLINSTPDMQRFRIKRSELKEIAKNVVARMKVSK